MIRGYSIHIGLEHVLYDNLSEGEVNNYTSESTRVSSFDRTKNTRDPLGKSLEHLEQRCVRYCTGIFRYRYWCRTELTEVSGSGIDVVPNLPKCPAPVIPAVFTGVMPRYVPYRKHPWNVEPNDTSSSAVHPISCSCICTGVVLFNR